MDQTPAQAKVMRAIIAREAKAAKALRRELNAPPARRAPPVGWDTRPAPPQRKSEIERAREARADATRLDWARRHPERARQERAFRKSRAEAQRAFGTRHDGTPETLAHARRQRQGSIARLWESGAIDAEQLAAAARIAAVHERIGADVSVRTASLETRIDGGRRGDAAFFEALGAVRDEIAYSRWRTAIGGAAALVLAVIAGESLTATARAYRIGHRRAVKLLGDALDAWHRHHADARAEVDAVALERAHAAIA